MPLTAIWRILCFRDEGMHGVKSCGRPPASVSFALIMPCQGQVLWTDVQVEASSVSVFCQALPSPVDRFPTCACRASWGVFWTTTSGCKKLPAVHSPHWRSPSARTVAPASYCSSCGCASHPCGCAGHAGTQSLHSHAARPHDVYRPCRHKRCLMPVCVNSTNRLMQCI